LDFGQKCTLGTKCSGTEQNVLAWNEIFLPATYHLGGRERNPPTSILLHSRKYTYYYMSTREMFPGLFSSCLFTSAQRIKSSRIFASVSFDYSYKIVITFTVQYVDKEQTREYQ